MPVPVDQCCVTSKVPTWFGQQIAAATLLKRSLCIRRPVALARVSDDSLAVLGFAVLEPTTKFVVCEPQADADVPSAFERRRSGPPSLTAAFLPK